MRPKLVYSRRPKLGDRIRPFLPAIYWLIQVGCLVALIAWSVNDNYKHRNDPPSSFRIP